PPARRDLATLVELRLGLAAEALGANLPPARARRLGVERPARHHDAVDLARRLLADEAGGDVTDDRLGVAVDRVAVPAAAHEAHILRITLLEVDVAERALFDLLAAQRLEAVAQLVDVSVAQG